MFQRTAWRVGAQAAALGAVHGREDNPFGLTFVRFEPAVIPKRSLTGAPDERVDTRVLQVIYGINAAPIGTFVGQQVDVFIESVARSVATNSGNQP